MGEGILTPRSRLDRATRHLHLPPQLELRIQELARNMQEHPANKISVDLSLDQSHEGLQRDASHAESGFKECSRTKWAHLHFVMFFQLTRRFPKGALCRVLSDSESERCAFSKLLIKVTVPSAARFFFDIVAVTLPNLLSHGDRRGSLAAALLPAAAHLPLDATWRRSMTTRRPPWIGRPP